MLMRMTASVILRDAFPVVDTIDSVPANVSSVAYICFDYTYICLDTFIYSVFL